MKKFNKHQVHPKLVVITRKDLNPGYQAVQSAHHFFGYINKSPSKKMNYSKIYESLISNAQLENRIKHKGIYYENHHILPKSLGGRDSNDNLVLLTAKEHFIAHKLLLYIHEDSESMQRAFHMMCRSGNGNYKVSSRDYLYSRELLSKSQSINRRGQNNPMYGRKISDETRKKLSIAGIRRTHTDESKKKMSESKLGDKNPIFGKPSPNKNHL